jgi:hypothetical protein
MEQSFTFNNAKVKYVSTKEQYCCDVSYFVVDHDKTKEQLKVIEEKYKGLKMPFFTSDDTGDYILKVKSKFITDGDLELKNKYKCNLNFEYYNYNDSSGFYIKMDKISATTYNTSKENRKVININN